VHKNVWSAKLTKGAHKGSFKLVTKSFWSCNRMFSRLLLLALITNWHSGSLDRSWFWRRSEQWLISWLSPLVLRFTQISMYLSSRRLLAVKLLRPSFLLHRLSRSLRRFSNIACRQVINLFCRVWSSGLVCLPRWQHGRIWKLWSSVFLMRRLGDKSTLKKGGMLAAPLRHQASAHRQKNQACLGVSRSPVWEFVAQNGLGEHVQVAKREREWHGWTVTLSICLPLNELPIYLYPFPSSLPTAAPPPTIPRPTRRRWLTLGHASPASPPGIPLDLVFSGTGRHGTFLWDLVFSARHETFLWGF
jgi:hypothetical protein